MTPLHLTHFTATSCLGRGLAATLEALEQARSGLSPCHFDTVELQTYVGEVAGIDAVRLPQRLQRFDCRNNRLARLGLIQDGFDSAVRSAIERWGRRRIGVYLGTSTSGILTTEIAYRHLDPDTGALPEEFDYTGSHNAFSVADFVGRLLELAGPAVAVCTACSSTATAIA